MKKKITLMLILMMTITMMGCSKADANGDTSQEREKAVKVLKIVESQNPVQMEYVGTVDSKDVINYSFKSDGQIKKIYVKKGDIVSAGSPLAELDSQDLQFQGDTAKAAMDLAEANMIYNQDLYAKMVSLHNDGAVSKNQFDKVKLEMDVAEATYRQTKEKYDYTASLIRDAKVYAEQDGSVVDVLFDENERTGPNEPIIIVRSGKQIINIGIPQQDLNLVKLGAAVTVDVDGEKAVGQITNISEAPDMATRTYSAEIEVPGKEFRLGSIVAAQVEVGEQNGVWIPMSAVFSDGEDYVYIIKENRAYKRTIELLNESDDKILVKGIKIGESLAVSGMKNLDDGTKVNIVK